MTFRLDRRHFMILFLSKIKRYGMKKDARWQWLIHPSIKKQFFFFFVGIASKLSGTRSFVSFTSTLRFTTIIYLRRLTWCFLNHFWSGRNWLELPAAYMNAPTDWICLFSNVFPLALFTHHTLISYHRYCMVMLDVVTPQNGV